MCTSIGLAVGGRCRMHVRRASEYGQITSAGTTTGRIARARTPPAGRQRARRARPGSLPAGKRAPGPHPPRPGRTGRPIPIRDGVPARAAVRRLGFVRGPLGGTRQDVPGQPNISRPRQGAHTGAGGTRPRHSSPRSGYFPVVLVLALEPDHFRPGGPDRSRAPAPAADPYRVDTSEAPSAGREPQAGAPKAPPVQPTAFAARHLQARPPAGAACGSACRPPLR